MKMHFKVLILFFCALQSINAEERRIAYQDAISLRQSIETINSQSKFKATSSQKIWSILKFYFPVNNQVRDTISGDSLINLLKNNPFFVPYLPGQFQSNNNITTTEQALQSQSFLSSISGIDVTTLADGLAKFLVQRAKTELSITFFTEFKKKLEDKVELGLLFPQTKNVLSAIDQQIYNYSYFIEALRIAFIQDLQNLPLNLTSLLSARPDLVKDENFRKIIISALPIVNMLMDGEHPYKIIDYLAKNDNIPIFENDTIATKNVKNGLKLVNLISQSLITTDTNNRRWVTMQQVQVLVNDPITFQIYVGLLYQQGEDIQFRKKNDSIISFRKLLVELKGRTETLSTLKNYIESFSSSAHYLDIVIQDLSKKQRENTSLTFDDYYKVTQTVIDMLKTGYNFTAMIDNKVTRDTASRFLQTLELLTKINLDIKQKNYSSAIINSVLILQDALKDNKDVKNGFIKYGSFIAMIAKAESSDDVEKAIESFALPSGSAIVKRNTAINVSLNAYTGLNYGWETLTKGSSTETKNIFGCFAPVGPEISFGLGAGWNMGVFISLIDVGALTAFRFNDFTTKQLPEFTVVNIVSPGAFVTIGLPNVPITIGGGYHIGPQLRQITDTKSTIVEASGYKISLFLAVDIPLLNFYTKPW